MAGAGVSAAIAASGRKLPREFELGNIVLQVPVKKGFTGDVSRLPFQAEIVKPLRDAGLLVLAFRSVTDIDGTYSIFLLVSATVERLLMEAERTGMKLKLDERELGEVDEAENRRLVAAGMSFDVAGRDSEHLDLHIPTVKGLPCNIGGKAWSPYERIWAPYNPDTSVRPLYAVEKHTGIPLSETQIIALLISIIEAPKDTSHGAQINLDQLVTRKRITTWFPGHSASGLDYLDKSWGGFRLPWNLPIGQVKRYFSERVGFYFAFLGHYASWLIIPAIVGVGIFIHQVSSKSPNVDYLPLYGIAVALWSTLFMEFWKREQNKLAQKWGMNNYKTREPLRPEYTAKASRQRSFVDGKPTFYVNPGVYRLKRTVSTSIILTALGIVIVVVGSIFILRVTLKRESNSGRLPSGWPDYITSIINAVQIQVANVLYTYLARMLTNFENHATGSAYDNALTLKLAVFQSINTYFGLVYIAAIKNNISIRGEQQSCNLNARGEPDCMSELQSQLAILMLTRLVLGVVKEFLLPWITPRIVRCWRRWRNKDPVARARLEAIDAAKRASSFEREAALAAYAPFEDYLEVMLQFGFVTLFVVAFPLAPLIALVGVFINIYLDRTKMMRMTRPAPEGAQDIGAWLLVFEFMAYASAVSNLTIVVFTNRAPIFGNDWNNAQRLIFFVIAEHVLLAIKYTMSTYIPDLTASTALQLDRQDYLVAKHIFKVKDLIISKEEAARTIARAASAVPDEAGAGAGANPMLAAPVAGGVVIESSFFALSGIPDPRVGTPADSVTGGVVVVPGPASMMGATGGAGAVPVPLSSVMVSPASGSGSGAGGSGV